VWGGRPSGCPGDSISLKCSMHSQHLVWKCPDGAERVIGCGDDPANILPRICQNQTLILYFLHHNCTMITNQIVLTSFVKFNASTYTLTCENPHDVSIQKTFTIPFEGGLY